MERLQKKSLPVASLNWLLVLLWMGLIFWFSAQPASSSAFLSSSVLNVSAVLVTRWRQTFMLLAFAISRLYGIWAWRRAETKKAWIIYAIIYLYFCALALVFLYQVIRPLYSDSDLHHYSYGAIHSFFRKYAHLFIYFFLGMFVKNALNFSGSEGLESIILAVLICCFYAVTDEFHQFFVPGRAALFTDVIIDTVGAAAGILIYTILGSLCGERTIWQVYWNL